MSVVIFGGDKKLSSLVVVVGLFCGVKRLNSCLVIVVVVFGGDMFGGGDGVSVVIFGGDKKLSSLVVVGLWWNPRVYSLITRPGSGVLSPCSSLPSS